jgi:hypothetical protein
MVDFISEVEEELRKDDYNKFLRQYGPLILGLLIGVVLVVGFLEWRSYSQERTARAAAASYLAADNALNEGRPDAAAQAFLELADVAPDGYAGLSLMRAAVIAGEQGNAAEAVRLYDLAADRLELDRHTDLARLKAAYVLANEGQWADVRGRAQALAVEGAPYEYLARELVASAALNSGDVATAEKEFRYLSTIPGVPQTVARRAEQALVLMTTQAAEQAEPIAVPEDNTDLPAPNVPGDLSSEESNSGEDPAEGDTE